MPPTTLASATTFFTSRVESREGNPQLTALCAGYEENEWRQAAFVDYLFEYVLEFALQWSQLQSLDSPTAARMIQDAARRVYESAEREKCGEFGELLLHAALRSHFNSVPTVSKLFYKTGRDDVVKGFDCVHVVAPEDGEEKELWLGEARFCSDISEALQSASDALAELTQAERLKREFVLIRGLVDEEWPYAEQFKALTAGKSLDGVFDAVRIPVLLTYDSAAVNAHQEVSSGYEEALHEEVAEIFARFVENAQLPADISTHLILIPVRSKDELATALRERLVDLRAT